MSRRSFYRLVGFSFLILVAGCDSQTPLIESSSVTGNLYHGSWIVSSFEVATQASTPIDVVWLIDSDKDMEANRNALISNTQAFMQQFTQIKGLDWKLGVLSTNSIAYAGFTPATALDSQVSDPVTPFENAVQTISGLSNGPDEVYLPIQTVLTQNSTFVRPNAKLALIMVTNAPDSVDDSASVRQTHYQNFISFLTQLKSDPSLIAIYPILKAQDFSCPQGDDPLDYAGSSFQTLVGKYGGKAYALCSPTFGSDLVSLAGSIVQGAINGTIALGATPSPNSASVINVTYQGQAVSSGVWQYDSSKDTISFSDMSFATDPTASVEVTFPINSATTN